MREVGRRGKIQRTKPPVNGPQKPDVRLLRRDPKADVFDKRKVKSHGYELNYC